MSVVAIGNYRLSKTIGVGSFGKVKLAEHIITGHQVAVKILNRKKIKSLKMDAKIRREIQIMKLFRHPHIVKLYEVIETPSDILLIMEYVNGGELFEYIVSHGKIDENSARLFFQQIIAAVEYCHKHMVVHRDLKPENLLLDTANNCVKIADFGLSNVMEYGDFLKTSCGSPNYASPEVISGKLYAGPEVDVWSCGVILYALLCARLPFDDEFIPSLFKKIRGGIYTPPEHCSASCRELIGKMLTVDPLKRITVPEIRAHPWFQESLPAYLAQPPVDIHARVIQVIDQSVLEELSRALEGQNVTQEQLRAELLRPPGPNDQVSDLVIAYHLIYDNKYSPYQMQSATTTASSSASAALLATSPPMNLRSETPFFTEAADRNEAMHGTSAAAAAAAAAATGASSSTSSNQAVVPMDSDADTPLTEQLLWSHKKMWCLGMLSKQSPKEIMSELFNALLTLDFSWKMISAFRIRCKRVVSPTSVIKLSVQLYQLSPQKHLLDFKRVEGEQFAFFDSCLGIINIIQKEKWNHKVTPSTLISKITADACEHFTRKEQQCALSIDGKAALDPSLSVRFAGLSARTKLHLITQKPSAASQRSMVGDGGAVSQSSESQSSSSSSSSSGVRLAIQVDGGKRFKHQCENLHCDLLTLLLDSGIQVKTDDPMSVPSVLVGGSQRICGPENLRQTSLASLGLKPGASCLLRFSYDKPSGSTTDAESTKPLRQTGASETKQSDEDATVKETAAPANNHSTDEQPFDRSQRSPVVIIPQTDGSDLDVELPPQFFELTAEELKAELQSRKARRQREEQDRSVLKTRAIREREQEARKLRYDRTGIRVRFPDAVCLQGNFGPSETIGDLRQFIRDHLRVSYAEEPFHLFVGPPRKCLDAQTADHKASLQSLGLVPTALVHLVWQQQQQQQQQQLQHAQQKSMRSNDTVPVLEPPFLLDSMMQLALASAAPATAHYSKPPASSVETFAETLPGSESPPQSSPVRKRRSHGTTETTEDAGGATKSVTTGLKIPKWLKLNKK